ncbi:MAG: RluA family pseudouridine synthase [Candidatus Cyclobacteriaceae bacterium M2_1C_046]
MIKFKTQTKGTIKEQLQKQFPEMSGRKIKNLIQYSQIEVDGILLGHPNDIIGADKEVKIEKRQKPSKGYPYEVLYEDEHYIIAEKPAGVLTSAPPGVPGSSFYMEMNEAYKMHTEGQGRLHAVHRLDREVEGLVAMAKSEKTAEFVKENWKKAVKKYYALVEGVPEKKEGKIETWLYEDKGQIVHASEKELPDAKWAVTEYKVKDTGGGKALLELELGTGRKNQLRVHMNYIGHPIVGDYRYGADKTYQRQIRLYAYYLELPHPVKKETVKVQRQLPGYFWKLPKRDEQYK